MKTKGAKSFVWVKASDLAAMGDVDVKVSRVWVEKKAPDLEVTTDDDYTAPCVITATTSENPEPKIQFTVS